MSALAMILAVALATMFTRALPFFLFARRRLPRAVVYLGRALPPAIMAALVVYCLKGVDVLHAPYGMAEFVGVAVVVLVHGWRKNTLLSIFAGTACYMALIRILPLMG